MHFGGQFEHETHFCEICAKTAEQRPEVPSRFCLQGTQTTSQRRPQLHFQLVMKHGCMVTTLRLSSSRRSVSRQIHCGRKKSVSSLQQCQVHVDHFFSNIQGIVHKKFVPPGQTINGKFYCEVLKRLREGIQRKCPDNWKKNNWFLHHDNAPAHTSLVVQQFVTSKHITVIPPPFA